MPAACPLVPPATSLHRGNSAGWTTVKILGTGEGIEALIAARPLTLIARPERSRPLLGYSLQRRCSRAKIE